QSVRSTQKILENGFSANRAFLPPVPYDRSLLRKKREMHQRAAIPTSVKIIRLIMPDIPPKSAPTRSYWKRPTLPQLIPPITTSRRAILSIQFIQIHSFPKIRNAWGGAPQLPKYF